MASLRLGVPRHGISSDATQSKRSGAYMETDSRDFPSSLSRRARKAAENARPGVPDAPQARKISKIPQTSSRRGPPNAPTPAANLSAGPASRVQDSPKQPRDVLPRDHPSATEEPAGVRNYSRNSSARKDSSSSVSRLQPSLDVPSNGNVDRWLAGSPAEIRFPQKIELPTTNVQDVTVYPELDRYRDFKPQAISDNHFIDVPYPIWTDLPPPTPLFSGASSQQSTFSGSPSTRFSGSPGPGPYSRDTTPTSMSSYSPSLVAPIRTPAPMKRPPVTRRRAGSSPNDAQDGGIDREGLSMVRESVTSYCSNSTVRDATKEHLAKKRLSPIASISPIWNSSQEPLKRNGDTTDALSKPAREPRKPISTVPSSSKKTSTARPAWGMGNTSTTRPMPPRRPSREGTTDLNSQLSLPLPVVHSNLSSTSLGDRRGSSTNLPSTHSSRSTTPSQVDRSQQPPAPRVGREPTPAPHAAAATLGTQTAKPEPPKTARTPSPNVSSSFKTRFPLFSRRNKSVSEVAPTASVEKKDRPPRKGPAAGTGHEGYGRLGQARRRSGSMSTALRVIPGTMSSQESLASNQPSDPFLAERMNPVVIAGGEVIENRNASSDLLRTESNQGYASSRPSLGSKSNSEVSLLSQDADNTLWPSALPRGATPTPARGFRRPSDSSDSDGPPMKPTLAVRRSMQRLKTSDKANMNVPKPIAVRQGVPTPSINSHDTTLMSDDSLPRQMATKVGNAHPAPKKLVKRPRSPRKWNLFGRSSQAVGTKKQPEAPQLSAAVKVVQPKPVAFYAMIDSSEQEDNGSVDVKEVLREAQVSSSPPPPQNPSQNEERLPVSRNQSQAFGVGNVEVEKPEISHVPRSMPAVVQTHKQSDPAQPNRVSQPSTTSRTVSTRPSRLPQVGRIPKVTTSRPEPMPLKSFSRPFKRASLQTRPLPKPQVSGDEFVAKGPSPPNTSSPMEETRLEEKTAPLAQTESNPTPIYRLSSDLPSDASRSQNEFFIFPRHKKTGSTSTSSSSSCSELLTYADATAVVPSPSAPMAEDEIWDEYNDLIGEDAYRVPPSAGSSQGRPFHLEMWDRRLAKEKDQSLESPTIDMHAESDCETEFEGEAEIKDEPAEPKPAPTPVSSSIYSSDMTAKINEALEAAGGPTSSFSISEFVSGYGDDENKISNTNNNMIPQAPNHRRTSTSWSLQAGVVRQSHASGSSQGSDDNSPVSQVNLRVGSMTVSKWLTFGHVLFSPVRDELVPIVGSLKRHSILVIDGLGNDDWSFYAAETYPAATFFNLSPRAPLPTDSQTHPSATPLSPPNHHQIQYKSPMDKFPFGPQSFTAVVYRFPAAAPESHYRNIITEARRVLKPGGYLELSILDMDMNNMGNRARRSVRQLKERIHLRAPDVSLSSSADLMLRLLGRKGFTDIKNCRVGVPVASAISPSPGTGMEDTSKTPRAAAGSATSTSGVARRRGNRDTRNLAEMISDDGPVADESITKMVAKVGRWWYDRCYVSVAREPGGKSMWNDQALLAECEEWRTTLKLMVCHARMPDGRSRVASI